ncbi:MAG: calcium/sodium antiporter [Planctomycetota bacterium]
MLDLVWLLTGLGALLVGGEWLVRGAVALARQLGVPPLIIGLTVVAFGTSTPELVVNLLAAWRGNSEVGFGNVVGSNVANIGLLLGLTAAYRTLSVQHAVIVREVPMMLLGTLAVLVLAEDRLLTGRAVDRFDRDDGLILLLLFGVFLYYLLGDALRARKTDASDLSAGLPGPPAENAGGGGRAGLWVLGGMVLLVVGGQLTVTGATGLARAAGVPEVVVALTLVAVGTSLPELATSLIAARRGQTDVAIANIVGSNIYNLLFVFGLTATVRPISLPAGGVVDLLVMAGFSVMLMAMAMTGRSIRRAEAAVLLACYVGYVVWLGRVAL